jgi:hypothetical protein
MSIDANLTANPGPGSTSARSSNIRSMMSAGCDKNRTLDKPASPTSTGLSDPWAMLAA